MKKKTHTNGLETISHQQQRERPTPDKNIPVAENTVHLVEYIYVVFCMNSGSKCLRPNASLSGQPVLMFFSVAPEIDRSEGHPGTYWAAFVASVKPSLCGRIGSTSQ